MGKEGLEQWRAGENREGGGPWPAEGEVAWDFLTGLSGGIWHRARGKNWHRARGKISGRALSDEASLV
jgi:hypothetical protein